MTQWQRESLTRTGGSINPSWSIFDGRRTLFRLVGCTLFLGLTLAGEPAPPITTGLETKEEVDHLVDVCNYHHDGEDLSKDPRVIDLDDTGPNIAPIKDLCLVSVHLDDDQRM